MDILTELRRGKAKRGCSGGAKVHGKRAEKNRKQSGVLEFEEVLLIKQNLVTYLNLRHRLYTKAARQI